MLDWTFVVRLLWHLMYLENLLGLLNTLIVGKRIGLVVMIWLILLL